MFRELIPQSSLNLVKYSGGQLIERLGADIISNVVLSILKGSNIRSLTEGLTQRRILLMNSSLFVTYIKGLRTFADFTSQLNGIISSDLANKKLKLSQNEKQYMYWFLGLTLKSIDNVARGKDNISEYLKELDDNLSVISKDIEKIYGPLEMQIKQKDNNVTMNWPSLLRCMLALGSQTLTIRGSEKSMYGKLFEKFVLGYVLTLLGAEYIDKDDTSKDRMVFWLSWRDDRRESDATLLIRPGYGISFDIGFIGRGNPEVVMDKLTRFESHMERGGRRNIMSTIVLIDTLGEGSRASDIAYGMGGHVVQMSGTYWVHELVRIIKEEQPYFEHPLLEMTPEESLTWLDKQMPNINLEKFLTNAAFDKLI